MYSILYTVFNTIYIIFFFFFSSRRRHTRSKRDWSSDVCSSDLLRTRVGAGLDQRCGGAAAKVDQQIPEAAQQILDIVPENPQEQHVAAEMEPAAMQEHAGEDRRPGRDHR